MEVEEQNTQEQIILVAKLNDINDRFSSNSSEPIPHDMTSEELQHMVHRALSIAANTANTNYNVRLIAATFLLNSFRHSEHEALRKITLSLVSVRILATANPDYIAHALRDYPRLHGAWKVAVKKSASKDSAPFGLVPSLVSALLDEVASIRPGVHTVPEIRELTALTSQKYLFILKCMEFVCELLCQLPTRRFFHLYLQATHFITRLRRTALYTIQAAFFNNNKGFDFHNLVGFPQMVKRLERLDSFGIDDFSGSPLTPADVAQLGAERAQMLQRVCYKMFPDKLRSLALSNIGAVQNRTTLSRHLSRLTSTELRSLATALSLLSKEEEEEGKSDTGEMDREFVTEVILRHFEAPLREDTEAANGTNLALFPTERDLWPSDSATTVSPMEDDSGEVPLALPSLNLQFLSADDYLQRNFELFRCESVYGAREGLERAISAMRPRPHVPPKSATPASAQYKRRRAVDFCGPSRMALPLREAKLVRVAQPALGDTKPSEVLCELGITLDQCPQQNWRSEWEGIRKHDILYAVRVSFPPHLGNSDIDVEQSGETFATKYGVVAVRGCEVVDVVDATTGVSVLPKDNGGNAQDDRRPRGGALRTIRVRMDAVQYVEDCERNSGDGDDNEAGVRDFYGSFNLVVRRREEECNYKAVLETIRSLISTESASFSGMNDSDFFRDRANGRIPDWLENTILGYYSPNNDDTDNDDIDMGSKYIDLYDTFINESHIKAVYPNIKIAYDEGDVTKVNQDQGGWYYRLSKRKDEVIGYRPPSSLVARPRNSVPFTAAQVGAISAAMEGGGGLTLVEGPPGTGKTDVAVQIVSNLYRSKGASRILVITKSNNALNQIFEKLVALDVDERHCLRLGHGERSLETTRDFSPRGRVDHILERRLAILRAIDALAVSLGVPEHEAYSETCEAALLFRRLYVLPRWESFNRINNNNLNNNNLNNNNINNNNINNNNVNNNIIEFPFAKFFGQYFAGRDYSFEECWEYLESLFSELRELRPFELLRSGADRVNYLLTHEARVIAMTATYAALRRRDLQTLGFSCDAIVMEEAGQILEVETFVPLVLLRPAHSRVVMIGDHRQLPPVVKCPALRSACRFDQSMFARLVRLGVPTHILDAQGRSRESLAALYSWAYPGGLRTLPSLLVDPRFAATSGNPGFARVFQLVDVMDAREAEPVPHFYQNVAEAEFLVHTYIYMRLLGYPRESIAILTTYNGQRSLLREVVAERCCKTQVLRDIVGAPAYVGTVDKFQGRQADYVLLSLVRTEALGHVRDPRRLVVALSRARLGLYVFGSKALFLRSSKSPAETTLSSASKDLTQIMSKLFSEKSGPLQLIPSEKWGSPVRRDDGGKVKSVANVDELLPVLAPLVSAVAPKSTTNMNGANMNGDEVKMNKHREEKEEEDVKTNGGAIIESMVDMDSEDVIIPIHTNSKNVTTSNEEDNDEDMDN